MRQDECEWTLHFAPLIQSLLYYCDDEWTKT